MKADLQIFWPNVTRFPRL